MADDRPTLEAPDDDPHLWLEDIEGTAALAWVSEQNARTFSRFVDARVVEDREALTAVSDLPDSIPYVTRYGARVFNFWKDEIHVRGVWRAASFDSYRSEKPHWEILLDLDRLAAEEHEDWVWRGAVVLPSHHDRAIVSLSRGGADAVVMRELDLVSRCFVDSNGFFLPESKGWATWLDRDTVLFYAAFGNGMATRSGFPRTVRLWRRGSDARDAAVVFESDEECFTGVWAYVDATAEIETIWFVERRNFLEAAVWFGDRFGPRYRLDVPTDAVVCWAGEWVALRLRGPWVVGETTYQTDTVLGIALSSLMSERRDFSVLFVAAGQVVLQGMFWCAGALVLSLLDQSRSVFESVTPTESGWVRIRLHEFAEDVIAAIWPLDGQPEESDGRLLCNIQGPLTPPSLLLIAPAAAPHILKRSPEAFDASGFVVTHHHARSQDGTLIPYDQVGPAGAGSDAPVLLNGYGGLGLSPTLHYRVPVGKLWLERGGTSVVAHIRGGGEFGAAWHRAGRREGKRNAHDDFAAVAVDLVRRGVTHASRIAAEGGSIGGLLVANMLTRYPDCFGALLCTTPLVDMRRYSRLLAGASAIDEFGDPDNPEDWIYLAGISAYHVASRNQPYPPILLTTNRRDDRTHPGHARKMVAKLQAMGYSAYLYETAAGGHSDGQDANARATHSALCYAFLRRMIGWESA